MRHELERGFAEGDLDSEPFVSMGAYEALWDRPGASFPSIARAVRQGRDPLAGVDRGTARQYALRSAEAVFGARRVDWFGVRTRTGPGYPARLLDMRNALEVLWYRGDWDLAGAEGKVAVIGSRNAPRPALDDARELAHGLAKAGLIVASGLAKGIDAAAHRAAIGAGGRTVAVIGTPIHESFPRENEDLQEEIASCHLLVSQVPVVHHSKRDFSLNSRFFPLRNATMSAISDATVIVEAGARSGTIHQARAALAQRRPLFVMEGCFRHKWAHDLVRRGAVRVDGPRKAVEAAKGSWRGRSR